MGRYLLVFLLVCLAYGATAQDRDKLFGTGEKKAAKSGFIINVNGDFDIPAADMAKRFGDSYRVGPALL